MSTVQQTFLRSAPIMSMSMSSRFNLDDPVLPTPLIVWFSLELCGICQPAERLDVSHWRLLLMLVPPENGMHQQLGITFVQHDSVISLQPFWKFFDFSHTRSEAFKAFLEVMTNDSKYPRTLNDGP
jgi:hypothetical protein